MSPSPTRLCAVLLNPPLTSGNRTRAAVNRAAALVGHVEVTIANLVGVATDSSSALGAVGDPVDWTAARTPLLEAVWASDELLFGWGLTAHLGLARRPVEEQVGWLLDEAHRAGHREAWAVGEARHPSRWHQYTADLHGRTTGGLADQRLQQVLTRRPLAQFQPVERVV